MPILTRRMSRALSEEHLPVPPPPTQEHKETQPSSEPGLGTETRPQRSDEDLTVDDAAEDEIQIPSLRPGHTVATPHQQPAEQQEERSDGEVPAEFEDMDPEEVEAALHRRDSSAFSDASDAEVSGAASSDDDELSHTPPGEQSSSVLEIIDDNDNKGKGRSTLVDGSRIPPKEVTSLSAATAASTSARSAQPQPTQPKYESIYIPPVEPEQLPKAITYKCWNPRTDGAFDNAGHRVKCTAEVQIRVGAPMRCSNCGSRVLMKVRTKRMTQFEAR